MNQKEILEREIRLINDKEELLSLALILNSRDQTQQQELRNLRQQLDQRKKAVEELLARYQTHTKFVEIVFYGYLDDGRGTHTSNLIRPHLAQINCESLDLLDIAVTHLGNQHLFLDGCEYNTVVVVNAWVNPEKLAGLVDRFGKLFLPVPYLKAYSIRAQS